MKRAVGILLITVITGLLFTVSAIAAPIEWKMVTNWSPSINLWESDQNFCNIVNKLSGGKLHIKLFKAGELVPSAGVFDAVSQGRADCGGDWSSYWAGKNMAFEFGASFPMGMAPNDYMNWYYYGGGKEIYNWLYGKSNMVYFLNVVTPMESGMRTNVPIKTLADFKGKKLRMAGKAAGYILQKLGAAQMMTAGGEIYQALQLKTIDGAEFCSPSIDWGMGFAEVTKYNITPGWHQPASALGVMINKKSWDALTPELKYVIEIAAQANMSQMSAYYDHLNVESLKKFEQAGTTVYKLSDADLRTIEKYAWEWVEQQAAKSPDYKKVAQSYFQYMKDYAKIRSYNEPFGHGRNLSSYPNIGLK